MKSKREKTDSAIISIGALLILIIARNIDFADLSNLEFSYKTVIYTIIVLLSIGIIEFSIKNNDKD